MRARALGLGLLLAAASLSPTLAQQAAPDGHLRVALREAGFELRLQATESGAAIDAAQRGAFEAFLVTWSGRADPDGNVFAFHACGSAVNFGQYCNPEVDRLLAQTRALADPAARKAAFGALTGILLDERPRVYLFHRRHLFAHTVRLEGFAAHPDGLVRPQGLRLLP